MIDIIINKLNNRTIRNGYTDIDVEIVNKKSTTVLLHIKVTGTAHHYTCGSYNCDLEELNVKYTHNCKSTNEFMIVLNDMKANERYIDNKLAHTDLEGQAGAIIKHVEDNMPEINDTFIIKVANKNVPHAFDDKCDISFSFDLCVYDNENPNLLLLAVKLIGILKYDKDDDCHCQETDHQLLHKTKYTQIMKNIVKYIDNNYTSLSDQLDKYIIDEFMQDFICELYCLY